MKKYVCYIIELNDMSCNMPIIYESNVDLKKKSWKPIKSMVGYIDIKRNPLYGHTYWIEEYFKIFDDYEKAKEWFDNHINQRIKFLEEEINKLKNINL